MDRTQALSLAKSVRIERIKERIAELARIGGTDSGGVTRLAFSEEDRQGRRLIVQWMEEAGLAVQVSPIGNMVGRLGSKNEDTPVVMTGSHSDTVVNGGRLDGALGVLAAIEAAQVIHEAGVTLGHPLEVVCFVMEESSRFGVGYDLGSKALAGRPIPSDLLRVRDRSGKTMAEAIYEMRSQELGLGLAPAMRGQDGIVEIVKGYIEGSSYPEGSIKAFLELHIEQGPVLHTLGKPIGVVTAIAAPTRFRVILFGEQGHSGTSPMAMRKDALPAAAEVILAVERLGRGTDNVVTTVSVMEVEPNVINVIPGTARLSVDVRSTSARAKTALAQAIRAEVGRIAEQRGIRFEIQPIMEEAPQPLPDTIPSLIEESCLALGYESLRLPSGAGHDAAQLATVVEDTGMIFVPSRDGISHDPREWTDEQDILKGAQVLLLSLLMAA